MNFIYVLNLISKLFKKYDIEYAVMGGFGIGLYGIGRTTQDIDFLIAMSDMDKLHPHLKNAGYERIYHNKNVSQYSSEEPRLGNLDFIHAFREISLSMLKHKKRISLNDKEVYVLRLEDIIGLKIQSMANDPERISQDKADIENILKKFSAEINWELLEEYFLLFKMDKYFKILKEQF